MELEDGKLGIQETKNAEVGANNENAENHNEIPVINLPAFPLGKVNSSLSLFPFRAGQGSGSIAMMRRASSTQQMAPENADCFHSPK